MEPEPEEPAASAVATAKDATGRGAGRDDARPAPDRRLGDDEMRTWLPAIRFAQLLPQALDRTLRDGAGINHAHYAILVMLARPGDEQPPMSEIARLAGLSRSRLSHAIDALVARGWVARSACGGDGRTRTARLTDDGLAALRASAPAHVAQIRELVLAPLDTAEREQLAVILCKLLPGIEASV